MLVHFSGREVGVSLLKPAANQRFGWLRLLIDQAIQNLQLLLEPFHALLEKPNNGFLLLDPRSAQTARLLSPKRTKRLGLKKLTPFEPQQG